MMEKENIKEQKNKIKGWNFNQPQECELCSLCSQILHYRQSGKHNTFDKK